MVLRSTRAGPGALSLGDVLDLAAARPLADTFAARRGADLEVDASAVRRVGGLCLQVLLSAADAWRSDGNSLSFHEPAPDFVKGLVLMGALPDGHLTKGDLP